DTTVDDPSHITWYGASQFEGQNYRDIFVAVSPDNGTNWNPYPVNVSKTAHFEEAFVSTPEIISGADLNMVYQGDIEPGTIMQNNDTYDDVLKNLIIVQKIAISQLLTLSLDSTSPCGQSELPLGTKDIVNNEIGIIGLYPNPANNYVNVSMQFLSPVEQVDIQLLNIAGNKLWSQTLNGVKESTTLIDTKSLAAGFYIVKIITDKGTTVRRLIKE
ncbi:MAG TPA: T9SS type A sorting domain-containing protein, partial [Chitinophagaceae bacterium]|nr:T9SS type A sorting domain-containing protein [Chitinophagaceae bacterium]